MIKKERYALQNARWPRSGRHVLAQFDDESVIVYQAYCPSIGLFAAKRGHFGGEFSLSRMSWIKPNFLWMMYRSGWGTKPGQEVTLGLRLRRSFFDNILALSVESSYFPDSNVSREAWLSAGETTTVRLQWDPDHDPTGAPVERRAVQLGLRGSTLGDFSREALLEIEDISEFVHEQRAHVTEGDIGSLVTPAETVYIPADLEVARHIRATQWTGASNDHSAAPRAGEYELNPKEKKP